MATAMPIPVPDNATADAEGPNRYNREDGRKRAVILGNAMRLE